VNWPTAIIICVAIVVCAPLLLYILIMALCALFALGAFLFCAVAEWWQSRVRK
jgi:hypothetical protein